MTGNDIISRSLFQSQDRPFRFAQKLLSSSELGHIKGVDSPNKLIYTYWACKEAAFKLDRKKGSPRTLNPKEYKVEIDKNSVTVNSPLQYSIYTGLLEVSENFIHVVLSEDIEQNNRSCVIPFRARNQLERSIELHQHISSTLTDGRQAVEKESGNIPHLKDWDISLSHCGHWGAWSAVRL